MPTGYSVHVALNRISAAHYGTEARLAGCHADARNMEALAAAAGIGHRTVLLDEQASAERVAGEFRGLAARAVPGDLVFATYSGHGAQVRDRQGDEPDGLDETWVTFDRMTLDDELRSLLATFRPGVRVMLVSDSCHSGTMARLLGTGATTSGGLGDRTRAAGRILAGGRPGPPPGAVKLLGPFIAERVFRENTATYEAAARALPPPPPRAAGPLPGPAIVYMGACLDNETALDGDEGWFSRCLRIAWAEAPASCWVLARRTRELTMPYQTPRVGTYGEGSRTLAGLPPLSL